MTHMGKIDIQWQVKIDGWSVKSAWKEVGGLSKPSKMPSHGYSLPAEECNVGSKLRKLKGSTCYDCYAMKGRYIFPNVQKCLYNRYEQVLNNPFWIDCMVFLILWYGVKTKKFRWHDSGDLIDMRHLLMIVEVARQTPNVLHWLPTREVGLIKQYKELYGSFPKNLVVRISATMVNGTPHKFHEHSSTVATSKDLAIGFSCVAPTQGNKCLDCMACWNPKVANVTYPLH